MAIERMGVPVRRINKLHEGSPHVLDLIRKRECDLVINTPSGSGARADGYEIRTAAVKHGIPSITTMTAATAAVRAIAVGRRDRRRSALAPGDPRGGARRRRRGGHDRTLRPQALRGRREPRLGRLPGRLAGRSRGARAGAGPVLHARRGRGLGRARRPRFLPRAISVAETGPARGGGVRLDFLLDDGRPGDRAARDARRGRGGLGHRPARQLLRLAARGLAGAAGAVLVGGGVGVAPLALLRRRFAERGDPAPRPARLPRRRPRRRPRPLLRLLRRPLPRGAARLRGRPRRPQGLRHGPAVHDPRRGRRHLRRRLLLRPAGDAGGGAGALRRARRCPASWRWSRRWPAVSAPASAARSRIPTAATCASASTARSCAATRSRR